LARLHRTRPGHHHDLRAADPDAVHRDDGRLATHLAARQLEGLENRLHRLHALERLEALEPVLAPVVADGADDRPALAAECVRPVAHPLAETTCVLPLDVRRARFGTAPQL